MYRKITLLLFCLFLYCLCQNQTTTQVPNSSPKKAQLADEMEAYRSFSNFMDKHNKTYNSMAEVNARFQVYKDNIRKSNKENSTTDLYNTGITCFSDMTDQEFQQTYANLKVSLKDILEAESLAETSAAELEGGRHLQTLPTSLDWRTKGAVTPVDNQGSCGCCWSFGISGNLEGQYFLKYGTMIKFSQQHMINCNSYGYECNGGLFANVYQWLMTIDGNRKYSDIPYLGYRTTCSASNFKSVGKVIGYSYISNDENTIMYELSQRGPLLVALNANRLKYYTSGILASHDDICDPLNLNHAVLLVGYGTVSGYPYWIVKNSWGVSWGESGYFRILRGSGICGINKLVMSGYIA
jgi:C1A family cysteine protease